MRRVDVVKGHHVLFGHSVISHDHVTSKGGQRVGDRKAPQPDVLSSTVAPSHGFPSGRSVTTHQVTTPIDRTTWTSPCPQWYVNPITPSLPVSTAAEIALER